MERGQPRYEIKRLSFRSIESERLAAPELLHKRLKGRLGSAGANTERRLNVH